MIGGFSWTRSVFAAAALLGLVVPVTGTIAYGQSSNWLPPLDPSVYAKYQANNPRPPYGAYGQQYGPCPPYGPWGQPRSAYPQPPWQARPMPRQQPTPAQPPKEASPTETKPPAPDETPATSPTETQPSETPSTQTPGTTPSVTPSADAASTASTATDPSGGAFNNSGYSPPAQSASPEVASYNPTMIDHAFKYRPISTPYGTVPIQQHGRTKLAEDNNPIPADRFIYNFDYFDNTRLQGDDDNVSVVRSMVGLEKAFFDQRVSLGVRVPFAYTLESDFTSAGFGSPAIGHQGTELGDVHLTFKGLVYRSETFNLGGGLGVNLPTASDVTIASSSGGGDFVRIENEAYILTPFVGAIYNPDERTFVQTWVAWDNDPTGYPVFLATGGIPGELSHVGTLNNPSYLQTDVQFGYWIYRAPAATSVLQGLAPFAELHYITPTNDPDVILEPDFVGDEAGGTDELYLMAGLITQIGHNLNASLGVASPLRGGDDRAMDWQIALRVSWYFGPSAWKRNPAMQFATY